MSKQIELLKPEKINAMSNEEIVSEINNIKDKTRAVGIRMMKKCDETDDIAELTQIMLDDQTNCIENIIEECDELDNKIKESKSLSKQFASWFSIFRSTKTTKTHYVIKDEKKCEKSKKILHEKKEHQEYEFKSDDPADEIAKALEERVDRMNMFANGFKQTMKIQQPMLDIVADKIDKSDCDIKNVTKTIKRF